MKFNNKLFYGWVIVIALSVIGIIIYGMEMSFGVFFKSIESEFNLSRAMTSSFVSISMILLGVFAFLGGWANDKYGPRIVFSLMGLFTGLSLFLTSQATSPWQLYISYSLLFSMGTSAMYVVLSSTVSRWFKKKLGLALGISGTGEGLGAVIMAPFSTYLISKFDWRMAYIAIGIIAWIVIIPLSMLLKKNPHEVGALPDGEKLHLANVQMQTNGTRSVEFPLLQALKTRSFWLMTFVLLLFAVCLWFIFIHLVPHITDMGYSSITAASIFSLMGIAVTVGKVLGGIMSDRIGRKSAAIFCTLGMAVSMLWLIWAKELWMLYLFALVFGYANGGLSSGIGAIVGTTFELDNIGVIWGVLDIGYAIGAAAGPAMGGFIFDVANSYSIAFLLCAGAMVITTSLILLVKSEKDTTNKLTGN